MVLAVLVCGLVRSGVASERPVLDIPRLATPPVLSDYTSFPLDAATTRGMAHVSELIQNAPVDGDPISQKTDVYLGYDDDNFYAVFVARDTQPQGIRANLSRRDQLGPDDLIEVMLDTYHDQRRAYAFVANPLGVQWDALWTEGVGFDDSWDTLWYSDGERTEFGYAVVLTIPFRSLRFSPKDEQEWGMLLLREIPRNNENAFWPHVSTRIEGRLNQAATIRGLRGISPGRNVEFIPYVTSRSLRLLDPDATPDPAFVEDSFDPDAGVDAKFVVLDNIAIDATVNPDFSQIESDAPQVTVNERFEVFFPEKRPFFLENASFFETTTNLLFTRRIADPQFGARTTGKMGPYAIGALVIDDEAPGKSVPDTVAASGKRAFVGALRVNRDISSQSTAGFLVTDREFDTSYNRVVAVDGRARVGDTWDARGQVAYSWTRDMQGNSLADPLLNVQANRNGRHVSNHLHYFDVGREFNTDLGFVTRRDIRDLHQSVGYTFRPEGDVLIAWGPSFFWQTIWDHSGTRLDWTLQPEIDWELTRQTSLELLYRARGERLRPEDFPVFTEDVDFSPWEVSGEFESRFTNLVNVELGAAYGRTINFEPPEGEAPDLEDGIGIEFDLTLRPTTAFNISNDYLFTRLTDDATNGIIFENQIFRSRWSWQFDRRFSLRAIVQYDKLDATSALSRLKRQRRVNFDFLLTYQMNAWTALYAGFNTDYRNRALGDSTSGLIIVPTDDLHNDSKQVFLKFSYLFRI